MRAAWYVYMLRCNDGSYYTGSTTDLERRLTEHNSGPRGARYTRSRRPVMLVYSAPYSDRASAQSAEAALKATERSHKAQLARASSPQTQ